MKMYKENFGFNNFNKTKMLAMFSIYIFIFVIFLSVGFSAFQEELIMEDISARVNLKTDVRVTGFKVATLNNNALASNTDYNYNRIYGDVVLPDSNSSVTYEMEITNIGNTKVGISSITGLGENLKYTLLDYTIGEPISQDGQYTLGITQTILISFEYADSATITSESQNFNLELEFKPFYTITYHGVPGEETHPTEIMEGLDLVIVSEMTSIERLKVTQDTVFLTYGEHYFYDETTQQLTVKNVTGDLLLSYRDTTYLVNLASSTGYFKESAYKNYIESIEFVNYVDISNAVKTYDLSQNQDESIIGWLNEKGVDEDGNTTYSLYIGSIYDIYSKNMESAFAYMYGLQSINFENLDTSESTSFNYTFYKTEITNLDLSTFNTSSAIGMIDMFAGMTKLETLDVSNFDTSKVTSMWYMFGGLSSITELDVSTFDTSKVTNMGYMFSGMDKLKTLKLGENFKTSNATTMENMFSGLYSIQSLDVSSFDTTSLLNAKNMFYDCRSLTTLDLSNFEMASVTNMNYMFGNMYKLETLIIDNFNTSSVTTMDGMFAYCQTITNLNITHFNTSNVTSMSKMFSYMYSLEKLDLSSFDTSNVTNMSSFIVYCNSLTELDFRNANFTGVTNSSAMFQNAPSTLTVIVKDADAQTWIQDKLGEGVGTVVIYTDLEGENTEGETTT